MRIVRMRYSFFAAAAFLCLAISISSSESEKIELNVLRENLRICVHPMVANSDIQSYTNISNCLPYYKINPLCVII